VLPSNLSSKLTIGIIGQEAVI